MKTAKIENGHRNFNIKSGHIDIEDRTVELSFSSEEPVLRWFGQEILDHKESSIDFSRLRNGAPILEDHKDGQIGVVLEAGLKDGRGVAKVKFSSSVRGQEIFNDIQDGIRQNVSFGYQIKNLTLESEEEGEEPVYRSKDWMPYEISIVGVPADQTIGIGRSLDEGNEIEVEDNFRSLDDSITELIEEKENTEKLKEQRLKCLTLKINKALK
jgi:hypothetical protein|tara:strand:- start:5558 stop:6193 length:636 start_codon:yes stop_codon:yes gene_type:complete